MEKTAGSGDSDSGKNILGGLISGTFGKGQQNLTDDKIIHGAIGQNTKIEPIEASDSLFNPFNAFRFHKFGPTMSAKYNKKMHYDVNRFGGSSEGQIGKNIKKLGANLLQYYTGIGAVEDSFEKFDPSESQKAIQNPTAQQILLWVKQQSEDPENQSLAPAPYQINDFLWCKYYGKVANNRLVTLRRYPWPVEDNMKLQDRAEEIPVPLAQAVTWFGEEVDNKLDSLLGLEWDLKWEELKASHTDIMGNEILVNDVLKGLDVTDETVKNALNIAIATSQGTDLGSLELMGYDDKLYDWMQKAYGDQGPYWNRVLGPVNVVNKNMMRARGMGEKLFKKDIVVKFEYSLRSYHGINPKIAFLDLLTNFLTLTYNTAPFWGGGYRYFPKPGVKISSRGSDLIEQGHVIKGIQVTLNDWIGSASGSTRDLLEGVMSQFNAIIEGGAQGTVDFSDTTGKAHKATADSAVGTKILDNLVAGKASGLMRVPLSFRSLLEGRPIGEWHMVVGNPMNPIATMGNLYVKSVKMNLAEALGADDFPSEISFTVHMGHGKPRAKQDIESMFNLGNGAMSFSALSPPSSASNTFGGANHQPSLSNTKFDPNNPDNNANSGGDGVQPTYTTNNVALEEDWPGTPEETEVVNSIGLNIYRARVTAAYGEKYGSSKVLGDYITKTKT